MSMHGPAMAVNTLADKSGFQRVVLCTGNGTRLITLNENGVPYEEEMPMLGVSCPFCLASANFVLVLPDDTGFVFAPTGQDLFEPSPITLQKLDQSPDNLHCLDPPFQA